MKKLIIIGGGASGLMAAYMALKNNAEVVIIEKKDRIGSKILATGNGHCNFTNEYLSIECYYGENKSFLNDAFSLFDNNSSINFFEEIGVPVRCKNGYYYPYNMEASSVLNALRAVINSDRLSILTETNVLAINRLDKKWCVLTDSGKITGDSLLVSCGSNASLKKDLNSRLIRQIINLGHRFNEFKPALTYLKIKEEEIKLAAGVRFPVNVSLISEGNVLKTESGELQITSRGISGICIFQLSRFVSRNSDKAYKCSIDFMPEYTVDDINKLVFGKIRYKTNMNIEEMFNGILPKKLIISLAKMVNLSIGKPVYTQEKELKRFVNVIKNCCLSIIGTGDVSESQCLTGGVDVNEINPLTMESRLHKGLYFSGEIIDIDGMCGGYNLQWAWTSGYIAGKNASID